ncbi:ABC transporter ATP-binding protein [Gloeobacter kilaueensis]|uniref:ABC transporter n=1 Tax=Gloeobacter kilaueensis (strain ATCC BAA-2537 / CCAP 1431/1 / ULC 316 / JS1) TaxID=1183438 RepID=U5QJI7_GLOK1|nr:ABC transporter ATP-binding protein [Gloeobacter kilaueensis]AGY59086.1 ABC transporter [Gloeobacter kilaueensis JS1]
MTNIAGIVVRLQTLRQSLAVLWDTSAAESTFLAAALLLQGLSPAVGIWLIKQVVDALSVALVHGQPLDSALLTRLIALWIGALAMETLLQPWAEALQGNLGEKLTARMNVLLMRKAEQFPDLSRFEDTRYYDELQILQQQAAYRPLNLLLFAANAARGLVTLLAMLSLLAQASLWLALLILVTALPQIYLGYRLQQQVWNGTLWSSPEARRMQYYSALMLTDTWAKEVRLFSLGSFFIERYLVAFRQLHRTMGGLRNRQAAWSAGAALLSIVGNGLAFYTVVSLAIAGRFSLGSVLLFVQALGGLQYSFSELVHHSTMLYDCLLYLERFFAFLQVQPTLPIRTPGRAIPSPIAQGIVFDCVDFCYPDGRQALMGVSFTLRPGELVALVGENGSGKTTLVKLLTRLYDPSRGSIHIDGEDLRDLDLESWRSQVATIFQDFGRYALTAWENIALADLSALQQRGRIEQAVRRAGADTLIDQLPQTLDTPLGKPFDGTELSGGEWQKLALARAFLREQAQLLILDEPTAALDPKSEFEIYQHFAELVRGRTALLVTHRLASTRLADRILVLDRGALVEEGNHEQLLQRGGKYAALWQMQVAQYGLV